MSEIQDRYNEIKSSFDCRIHCSERQLWAKVCNWVDDPCGSDFTSSLMNVLGEDPLQGDAAVFIGNNYFRSLMDSHSMVGVTEDELRAVVPGSWVERPISKGSGVKFAPATKDPGKFGQKGWIEFNRGVPTSPDPLHQNSFARISVGGLQYRAAAQGNPVIEQGLEASVQIVPGTSGNPGPALREAVELGLEVE